jgi:hypothetical protein
LNGFRATVQTGVAMPLGMLESPEVLPGEVRAELEKILASAVFSRSERSQRFLRYVCDLTLRGEASRINQYLIGSEVFRKGPDYSTQEDSLVRRQAHVLRQKLDAYYAREGRQDPIRIELPVGQYVPVFRRVASEREAPASPGVPEIAHVRTGFWHRSRRAAATLAAVTAAAGFFWAGWMVRGRTPAASAPAAPHPAVREIWGPWLGAATEPVICLSNPPTALVRYFPQAAPTGWPFERADVTRVQEKAFRQFFDLPAGGYLYLAPSRVNTKVGDALSAVLLASFFAKAGMVAKATQSRLLTWEDLRTQNFILLGQNEANPWIDPLLQKYPFRLGETQGQRPRYIVNTSPAPGEASEYSIEPSKEKDGPTQEYALISMLPGLDERRNLLLISGLNTQATQMATELLIDPYQLSKLIGRLREARSGDPGPWHFQLVVRTEVRDKVPATAAEIVALRVLPR